MVSKFPMIYLYDNLGFFLRTRMRTACLCIKIGKQMFTSNGNVDYDELLRTVLANVTSTVNECPTTKFT